MGELPVQDVVPGDGGGVGVAGVLGQGCAERHQMPHRILHCILQLHLVGLVGVDAQHHVLPADEVELRRIVLEPGHAEHVAHSVTVQPGVSSDHELVFLPHLHVHQIHQLLLLVVEGEELEVGHGGDEGVGDIAGLAQGVEVDAEVALGRGIHCADKRQTVAVIIESGNVLRHGPSNDDINVFGVRPEAGDDPLPQLLPAFRLHEVGELGVGLEDPHDGVPDGEVGDEGVESPGADVVAEEGPVLLQEADGSDEAGGEDGADAEDFVVLAEAAEHLGVHALVGVGAENGLVGAGVVGVGIVRPLLEVGAFVITGQHWPSR